MFESYVSHRQYFASYLICYHLLLVINMTKHQSVQNLVHLFLHSSQVHIKVFLCWNCTYRGQMDDSDEGHKPNHIGLTIKLFHILQVFFFCQVLTSVRFYPFPMCLGSRWSFARKPYSASMKLYFQLALKSHLCKGKTVNWIVVLVNWYYIHSDWLKH